MKILRTLLLCAALMAPKAFCEQNSSQYKRVVVSDGYVLGATVRCEDNQSQTVATAIATQKAGEYEFAATQCALLVATDGYIDSNHNGKLDEGEPKAPKMRAPGSYTNITPFTTLLAYGLSPQELAKSFDLQRDDFDIAIPNAPLTMQVQAIALSIYLSYLQSCSNNQSCDINTTSQLVETLRSGKKFNEVLPQEIIPTIQQLDSVTSYEEAEEVAATFLQKTNGAYKESNCSLEIDDVEEFFQPCPPGKECDKLYFSKETVEKIVQQAIAQKLQECKKEPQSCGIDAVLIPKEVSDRQAVAQQLKNRSFPIDGYYIHYGPGAYDWIYITTTAAIFKLEKGVDKDYNLRWSLVHTTQDPIFQTVSITDQKVIFGSLIQPTALTQPSSHTAPKSSSQSSQSSSQSSSQDSSQDPFPSL